MLDACSFNTLPVMSRAILLNSLINNFGTLIILKFTIYIYRSPGKVKKIKAFTLSTKKKEKDKEKKSAVDKESKKSSDKDKKSVEKETSKEKENKVFGKESKKEKAGSDKPIEKETRRPFDGHRHSTTSVPVPTSSGIPLVRTSIPCSSSSTVPQPSTAEKLIAPVKSLNVFLNAPVPMLLLKKKDKDKDKEKEHKEKDSKKEHSSTAAKVKLKLKRGSKCSLEDTTASP